MKKEERDWGEERKKDDRGGQLFCVLNYRFSKTEIPIGRLFVNLSTTTKKLSLKGVQFLRWLFAAHSEQTGSLNCSPFSK